MALRILISFILVSVILSAAFAGTSSSLAAAAIGPSTAMAQPTPVPETNRSLFTDYHGVTLGMAMLDARAKLGKAKDSSDQQDFYMISEGETVQIVYEGSVVKGIAATYLGAGVKPPTPIAVFGTDVEAKPDGSINKLVRYPKAGYWVSYIRTGGDDPMVMITLHKLHKGQL